MRTWTKRLGAWLLAIALAVSLAPATGRAVLADVYITAANDKLRPLNAETMPFWSDGVLYISNQMFEGTDLGVNYVRNNSMNLAVLYTPRTDLRFDLAEDIAYDKQGLRYNAHAIEKGGYVFFPLDLVCRYFGLTWSMNNTDTVPLIRVKNDSAALEDSGFIDAASGQMRIYYTTYEKWVEEQKPQTQPPTEIPPVHAAAGQKIFLVLESTTAEDTIAAMDHLGDVKATFLLPLELLEDGDLVRGLVARGHSLALRLTGETEREMEAEIEDGRALLWRNACAWLELVWYGGSEDISLLLKDLGCQRVTIGRDESQQGLPSAGRARAVLTAIGRYREDLSILLGPESGCLGGLEPLLDGLEEAQYSIRAWRLVP